MWLFIKVSLPTMDGKYVSYYIERKRERERGEGGQTEKRKSMFAM